MNEPASIGTATDFTPRRAIDALINRIRPVDTEKINSMRALGRILARPARSDRDSPPCDVSSMDGHALRFADISQNSISVCGESVPGVAPPGLADGCAVRIVTGAPLPVGADTVIPIEQIEESEVAIRVKPGFAPKLGQNIRRRGENLAAGEQSVAAGEMITPATIAALASFGIVELDVFRRVRVSVINTGQELVDADAKADAWQIRDSNGPSIAALLASRAWIDCVRTQRVPDDRQLILSALNEALDRSDAVLLTGAVSMGKYDQVPDILRSIGCEIVFHRLPLRPGKPVLGALAPRGQLVFGLPGNPVSALVMARVMALPVLTALGGQSAIAAHPQIKISNADDARIPLWWYRLVRGQSAGVGELVETRGSGDIVSLARSEGVVEIPPNDGGPGPWPYFSW